MPSKRPHVFCLSIPNPYFEGTNSAYVIDADPVTLIDTGVGTDDAFAVLENGLRQHGLSVDAIARIVLTHKHIDHSGLATRIQEQSGCPVFVHEDDWDDVVHLEDRLQSFAPRAEQQLTSWGVPHDQAAALAGFMRETGWPIRSTPAKPLVDGQKLPMGNGELEVIHTPGHTLGSICLRYDDYLFTGDHVLAVLSPNVGGGETGHPGLLRSFLNSLERVRAFHSDDLSVMPGHGEPFKGLERTCLRLAHHHTDRLKAIESILSDGKPLSVYQIAGELFGRLRGIHVWLGTAEAQSHLEYLVEEGRAVNENGSYRLA